MVRDTPGMRELLPMLKIPPLEVWLTTHRELFLSPRIRAIYDRLAAGLAGYLQRIGGSERGHPEPVIVTIVSIIAVGAVAVILFLGLWNMFRGGDANRSQMLMRARVVAQFVALIVILGALYFFGQGHAGS